MYYIYILYSFSADKYYIGYTSNWHNRLLEHNSQEYFSTYTAKYRPWKIAALFSCGTNEKAAIAIERFLKKQHSKKLIELLCDPDFVPNGRLAQLVRVPQLRD